MMIFTRPIRRWRGSACLRLTMVLLLACPGAAIGDEDTSPHVGIWCSGNDDADECITVYEMRADGTFVNYNVSPDRDARLDYFGVWVDEGETICFTQTGWAQVDLVGNETVATGELGLSTFYCNDVIELTDDTVTVTLPSSDELLTATRLDTLPEWATN